jgi:multiple sugar transport system ATP-binding protein
MGRAIVREPRAFLMDEPLSNLDAKLRVQMRAEIARIQRDLGVTTIYVTHDQTEAMTLGDRVAVMRRGVLQQVASPQVLYDHPENLFVAAFIGSPAMNLVSARLERADYGDLTLRLGGDQTVSEPRDLLAKRPALAGYVGRAVVIGVRPEDMADADLEPAAGGATLSATADLVEAMGSDVFVHFTIDAPPVITDDTKEIARDVGADVRDDLDEAGEHGSTEVIARFNPRTRAREGEPVTARIDTERLHFFDVETGASIWEESPAVTRVETSRVGTSEEATP